MLYQISRIGAQTNYRNTTVANDTYIEKFSIFTNKLTENQGTFRSIAPTNGIQHLPKKKKKKSVTYLANGIKARFCHINQCHASTGEGGVWFSVVFWISEEVEGPFWISEGIEEDEGRFRHSLAEEGS
jgi:hypothetical protein